jgi:hypothetical protein
LSRQAPPPRFARSPSPANAGEDWNRRGGGGGLAALEAAEGRLAGWERFARRRPGAGGLEAGYEARLGAYYAALRRLLMVPAPDRPALARKVALVVDHEVGALRGAARFMAVLKRDALRLCGEE